MQLEIRSHHIDVPDAVRTHVTRRLQFALSRFSSRIGQVTVQVADLNGPRSGLDKQCRILVHLPASGKRVIVEVTDGDLHAAVDQAADRLGRAVARELERQRERSLPKPVTSRLPAAQVFRRQACTRDARE